VAGLRGSVLEGGSPVRGSAVFPSCWRATFAIRVPSLANLVRPVYPAGLTPAVHNRLTERLMTTSLLVKVLGGAHREGHPAGEHRGDNGRLVLEPAPGMHGAAGGV
jgi:hypothetical protein